jgi:hypothetical protein
LFVGEPKRGVQRHHWLRYIGWSVVALCATAIVVTAAFGWFELELRDAYYSRGYEYWRQFNDAFQRSGIAAPRAEQIPRGPDEEGLMLEVRNPKDIPLPAQKLIEAFTIAHINIRPIEAPEHFAAPNDFAVFIGPAPIRWH